MKRRTFDVHLTLVVDVAEDRADPELDAPLIEDHLTEVLDEIAAAHEQLDEDWRPSDHRGTAPVIKLHDVETVDVRFVSEAP